MLLAPASTWIRQCAWAVVFLPESAVVLNVGFEVFLDFSLGRIGLKAKHHFPFRKHLLGPLELVFQDSAVDLLLKRLRQASAAKNGDCSAAHCCCKRSAVQGNQQWFVLLMTDRFIYFCSLSRSSGGAGLLFTPEP